MRAAAIPVTAATQSVLIPFRDDDQFVVQENAGTPTLYSFGLKFHQTQNQGAVTTIASDFTNQAGHKVPIYVVAIAPPDSDRAALQLIATLRKPVDAFFARLRAAKKA